MVDISYTTRDRDESKWSSRYYRVDCSDLLYTMKIDGPDERRDPENWSLSCLVKEHGEHPVIRISPAEYRQLVNNDEDVDEDG